MAKVMQVYRVAGFTVHSEIVLPMVRSVRAARCKEELADFSFSLATPVGGVAGDLLADKVPRSMRLVSRMREWRGDVFQSTFVCGERQSFFLLWHKIGLAFQICPDAGRVEVTSLTDSGNSLAPWYLLSHILGFLSHFKGMMCLHASAVQKGNRTIGLLGTNGRGKSTLTAFLVREGWSLVSDDFVLIESPDALTLRPTFPSLKLRRDALELLGLHGSCGTPVPGSDKVSVEVDGTWGKFTEIARPVLRTLYTIRRSHRGEVLDARCNSVDDVTAEACLTCNGYAVGLLPPKMRHERVTGARLLARRTPVRRLVFPSGASHLTRVSELLATDELMSRKDDE